MIRVLVVEDEDMIREKIKHNIDWHGNGFGEIYEAANGAEAWELFQQHRPEIVITDIQMPEMDGIVLTEKIKQAYPDCKVVIISGHAEFDYAKESIRLKVSDYILKPFRSRNLLAKVLKVKEEIDSSQLDVQEREIMRRQLIENRKLLQEKFFRDLLSHCVVHEPYKQISFLGLEELQSCSYHTVVLQIDFPPGDTQHEDLYIYNLILYQWIERKIQDSEQKFFIINYKLDQLVLIGFAHMHTWSSLLEGWIEQAWMEKGCRLTAGIGSRCDSLLEMHGSYQEACSAVALSTIHGKGIVFTYNDLNSEREQYSKQLQMLVEHKLYRQMKFGLFQDIKSDIKEILEEIKQARLNAEASSNIINHMLLLAYKAISELGFNAFYLAGREDLYRVDVHDFHDFEALYDHICQIFEHFTELIQTKLENRNVSLVMTIKQYIDEHYNKHITLTSLAKEYNISSSYLSILFREQTSQNFMDYLMNVRIQRAKELLRTSDLRIYEIAERIGYRDAYYFSTAFKKAVGINPTEYREYLDTGGSRAAE
ncbi:response regulator [Paenibacillus sp. GCM10012307]|uniref:Response regulator n=1 Tax=Paenibacillus roseus TaxID=2798579 RepID=A0A934MV21_9BACL|nr:response regulator [Paenibacillus roseus]MBJ6361647.1 response regulator [Paenibacillus roseus]